MVQVFDANKLSKAIRVKRIVEQCITLRTLAKKIKVSAATISRTENGQIPEIINFLRLYSWLEIPAGDFITVKK